MTKQRDSREMALKFLFCQGFVSEEESKTALKTRLSTFQSSFKAPSEVWKFTWSLINAFYLNEKEVDEHIIKRLKDWKWERISLTDKSILRIAVSETLYLETPPKVSINEALDLGKKYSTLESVSFINGILDALVTDLEIL